MFSSRYGSSLADFERDSLYNNIRQTDYEVQGYFMNTAVNLDRFGNYEFRTLWNAVLICKNSTHRFGDFRETISSVLGKNQRAGTLSATGRALAALLDWIDEGHCVKSIIE